MSYHDAQAWLADFRAAPAERLDEFLRRRATIAPLALAEPSDVLIRLFQGEGALHTEILGPALVAWLSARLAEPRPRQKGSWNGHVLHCLQALRVATHLRLPTTGAFLRDQFVDLTEWAWDLGQLGPGGRDVLHAYWRALAYNQKDRRFLGHWLRVCDRTGRGELPDGYQHLGLLGLRRLPQAENAPAPSDAALAGLERWARHLIDTEEHHQAFIQAWHSLILYQDPEALRTRIADHLAGRSGEPAYLKWWRADLGLTAPTKPTAVPAVGKEVTDKAIADLNKCHTPDKATQLVEDFIDRHEQHLMATGDDNDLPRAFGRLGRALRKGWPDLAVRLAHRGLDHAPDDQILWLLWGEALADAGRIATAETVFWEACRRFPDQAQTRTELGRILARQGRLAEAEAVLREATGKFPESPHLWAELGRVLRALNRLEDAISVLEEGRRQHDADAAILNELGFARLANGQADAARAIVERLRDVEPSAGNNLNKRITQGSVSPPEWGAPQAPAGTMDATLPGLGDSARASRADFLLGLKPANLNLTPETTEKLAALQEEARATLRNLLTHKGSQPVIRLMAARHGLLADVSDIAPNDADYPLRLEIARLQKDAAELARLHENFARWRPLTTVAWLRVDDMAKGGESLLIWLRRDDPTDPALARLHREIRGLPGWTPFTDAQAFLEWWDEHGADLADAVIDIAVLALVAREIPVEADAA